MAAVRGKEVVLLGADPDVVDSIDARSFELGAVDGGESEQQPVTGAPPKESRVELRADLRSHLVAAAADAGPDSGPGVPAAGLVPHVSDRPRRDAGQRAAPTPGPPPHHTLFR